jgi:ribonuclease HIII
VLNKVLPEDKKELVENTLNIPVFTENITINTPKPPQINPIYFAGSDESGKGDCFGPLVVASFYCHKNDFDKLKKYGVKDSKLLTDEKIYSLAEKIFLDYQGHYDYFVLMPEKYNELYPKFSVHKPGLNEMLAWMHSKTIGNLYKKYPFDKITIDKFGNEKMIKYYVEKECPANLEIIYRAESEITVAVASILARFLFLQNLEKLSHKYDITLFKGASSKVQSLRAHLDPVVLPFICKMHFKN